MAILEGLCRFLLTANSLLVAHMDIQSTGGQVPDPGYLLKY